MKIITVANQKGGVGKTTITAHLLWHLKKEGHRVVGVDLDSQGNLSDVMNRAGWEQLGLSTDLFTPNFCAGKGELLNCFFHGDINLIAVDSDKKGYQVAGFTTALKSLESQFDYCVIDTPPAWGPRLNVAIGHADLAVIPIELEKFSIDGLEMMRHLISFWSGKQGKPKPLYLVNRMNPKSPAHKKNIVDILRVDGGNFIPRPLKTRSALGKAVELAIPVWEDKSHGGRDAAAEMVPVINYILEQK